MYQCLYTLMYQSLLLRCINECILGTYGTDLRQVSEERDRYFINHWVGAVGQMPRHKRLFKRSHLVLGRVGRLHRHGRDDQVDGVRPVLTRPRRRRFVRLWKLVRASGCVDLLNWMTSKLTKNLHWQRLCLFSHLSFKIWANSRLFFVYFRLFLIPTTNTVSVSTL